MVRGGTTLSATGNGFDLRNLVASLVKHWKEMLMLLLLTRRWNSMRQAVRLEAPYDGQLLEQVSPSKDVTSTLRRELAANPLMSIAWLEMELRLRLTPLRTNFGLETYWVFLSYTTTSKISTSFSYITKIARSTFATAFVVVSPPDVGREYPRETSRLVYVIY